jgi:hypothetical protein
MNHFRVRKVLYVSGKYSDVRGAWYRDVNIRRAAEVAAELWAMGFAAICPHANTAHMEGVATYQDFIEGDLSIIGHPESGRRIDGIVMLPGWGESMGAKRELEWATNLGVPVYFWPTDREYLMKLGAVGDPDRLVVAYPAA